MKQKYDVIIVGSGIAGLTVAISLSQRLEILLLTKSNATDTATNLAQGGIVGVLHESDTVEAHVKDTLLAGDFHNNKNAALALSRYSKKSIQWLVSQGVSFDKKNGDLELALEAGHTKRRVAHVADHTGASIEQKLWVQVKNRANIQIAENVFCKDILVRDNHCIGVELIKNNQVIPVLGSSTVLATGGLGQLYRWTTNPRVATGDGIAMARRAGVELDDMEFIQFHPTALKEGRSPLFLISEAVRGEGAHIVDETNKRFLFNTLPEGELAPRDEVSRAIYKQQKKSEVCLDVRHLDQTFFRNRFPTIYKKLRSLNLDPSTDLIPITPAAHYSCGGIKTDLKGQTSLANLYAVGEVARTGVHGANRLASNSLLEGVVFGKRVSEQIEALSHSRGGRLASIQSEYTIKAADSDKSVVLHEKLQQVMWEKVGIVRRKKELLEAQNIIGTLDKQTEDNDLQLKNMLLAAHCVIEACLKREKSLGAHFIHPQ